MSPFSRIACLFLSLAALSAQAYVKVNINFQPGDSPVPLGYAKDIGAAWSDAAGKGWVTEASLSSPAHVPVDMTVLTRDRARSGIDARLNTIIHMQPSGGTAAAYEYAVPNGTYNVTVGVGDQPTYNSVHTIRVEGVTAISGFIGSSTAEFKSATVSVTVSDGKLTIDAKGGTNTKLNYVRIASSDAPADPKPIDLKVNFMKSTGTLPSGYLRDYGQSYAKRTASDQGSGKWTYGWVKPGTTTALDLSSKGIDRGTPSDRRLATLMQMQNSTSGSWEISVPNNWYTVAVSVGDASSTSSTHKIWIENQAAIGAFTPTAANHFFTATKVVNVTDGRLTVAAVKGTSLGTATKINYVTVKSGVTTAGRPSVSLVAPSAFKTGVNLDATVTAEVKLPNGPLNGKTLTSSSVQLFRSNDNVKIAAVVNTSGGGDVIVLQPVQPLAANTGYRLEVNQDVQDVTGAPFTPFSSAFTTGASFGGIKTTQVFEKVGLGAGAAGRNFTSLALGPDGKLYAATITGEICRYPLRADGTLGTAQVITSLRAAEGNVDRAVIGLTFDPSATADNLILWVTNNGGVLQGSPDWAGKLTRLSGADLETVQDYVVHFPRSAKDHMTNSIAFGPDGAIYLTQGSMSAMGAPDNAWSNRSEHLLNAAVLRVDLAKMPATLPLDIQTEDGGTYDPFAPGAPVTLYATGIRNAYDLVWHSNGSLYTATNSSAANGNTPSTPSPLPASCAERPDGPYTGPFVTGITAVDNAPPDYLYKIEQGGYYGHPNPMRCEWVLNGGNPTSAADPEDQHQYPVGTLPDRNFRGPHYVIGEHYSPDGSLEYKSGAFGGTLQGKLMIARYSGGDDILVLTPTATGMTDPRVLNIEGATLSDPLDIAENPANGNIYVTEYGAKTISLLRPMP